jgi:hypothetical protein
MTATNDKRIAQFLIGSPTYIPLIPVDWLIIGCPLAPPVGGVPTLTLPVIEGCIAQW